MTAQEGWNPAKIAVFEQIVSAGAFDAVRRELDVDRLWQSPKHADPIAVAIAAYLRSLPKYAEIQALVGIDKVRYPYGCIPLLPAICRTLNLPLVIWKEYGNILTGWPSIYGSSTSGGLLIVQDVIEHGLTPLRVALDLHDEKRLPIGVLTIADYGTGGMAKVRDKFKERTNQELFVETIFTIGEIASVMSGRRGGNR